MRGLRFCRAIIVAAAVSALIFSCRRGEGSTGGSGVAAEEEDSTMRLAYVPSLDALPVFVAVERGLFAADSLDVALVEFASHLDIDTALIGGSVDGALTDIIRTAQLRKKDSLRLVPVTSTEASWTLVACRSTRINRLQQFGDKTVAMTRFSATDYLTDKVFAGVKTAAPTFKVQINDVELRLKMLLNNELDGAWLPEPYAVRALAAGHKEIVPAAKYNEKLGVLVLRQAFTRKKEHALAAERLARAYSMACDTINKYGVRAFAGELKKYCSLDSATINRLPETKYSRAALPPDSLVAMAQNYLKE